MLLLLLLLLQKTTAPLHLPSHQLHAGTPNTPASPYAYSLPYHPTHRCSTQTLTMPGTRQRRH
jgi:hypothetical protein